MSSADNDIDPMFDHTCAFCGKFVKGCRLINRAVTCTRASCLLAALRLDPKWEREYAPLVHHPRAA